jgi:hypothetical protein
MRVVAVHSLLAGHKVMLVAQPAAHIVVDAVLEALIVLVCVPELVLPQEQGQVGGPELARRSVEPEQLEVQLAQAIWVPERPAADLLAWELLVQQALVSRPLFLLQRSSPRLLQTRTC